MSYAISFDMNTTELNNMYPGNNYNNAYADIERVLRRHGLERKQGSVYFGYGLSDVQCVVAVQDLVRIYPWFSVCVRDIQLLQILNESDMRPAIEAAMALLNRNNF